MNILFDTNVVLDVLLDRKPFSAPASVIFSWVEAGEFIGFLGATTVTTIFYLATKVVGKKTSRRRDIEAFIYFCYRTCQQSCIGGSNKFKIYRF